MAKEIRFNAFAANGVVHQSPGMWAHPKDQSLRFTDLDYWQDLAKLLERGKFDSVFLADGTGVNEVYGGSHRAAVQHGSQLPRHDPFAVVPVMAAVTAHLGFGVTGNVSNESPVALARRFTTLDHLTKGRMAWNIVTGFRKSSSRAAGRAAVAPRHTRYELADEYMRIVYQLWEGAWEDDAVLWDREKSQFADPDKVHRVKHADEHFDLDVLFTAVPSAQRTPLLFQAGTSDAGRDFAARHAECIFLNAHSKALAREVVDDVRARAARHGRNPRDVRFYPKFTAIVGETDAAAQAKYDDYLQYVNFDAALATYSGWTGIDFKGHDLDTPLVHQRNDASVSSSIDAFTIADKSRVWTLRDVVHHVGIGGVGPTAIGSASRVADEMQAWTEEADVDGFNLSYALMPGDFEAVVDLLVPELQARGVYKRDYVPGTLRHKVYGRGARLDATHPADQWRHLGDLPTEPADTAPPTSTTTPATESIA